MGKKSKPWSNWEPKAGFPRFRTGLLNGHSYLTAYWRKGRHCYFVGERIQADMPKGTLLRFELDVKGVWEGSL